MILRIQKGTESFDIGMLKLYILLYADDIVIFAETSEGLQYGLDNLADYCKKWKLTVDIDKTKIMIFRKGGNLVRDLSFNYEGKLLKLLESVFIWESLLQQVVLLIIIMSGFKGNH